MVSQGHKELISWELALYMVKGDALFWSSHMLNQDVCLLKYVIILESIVLSPSLNQWQGINGAVN